MNLFRSKIIIITCAVLAGGLVLALSLLQFLTRVPALIGSVSWNL